MRTIITLSAFFLTLTLGSQAFAHASMTMSNPADGDIIMGHVTSLQMTFDDPVVLTNVKMIMGDTDVPVDFERSSEAAMSFTVSLPEIHPGKYDVKWGALSKEDGHPMSGTFSFTLMEH